MNKLLTRLMRKIIEKIQIFNIKIERILLQMLQTLKGKKVNAHNFMLIHFKT